MVMNPWEQYALAQQPVDAGDQLKAFLMAKRPEVFAQPLAPQVAPPPVTLPAAANKTGVMTETRTRTKGAQPDEIQAAIDALNSGQESALTRQRSTIDQLKEALTQQQGADLPLDLTGLAALTDTWSGSNFSGVYRPQETAASRQAALEKLRGQITTAEQGLSENEVDLLRSKLNNMFQMENLSASKEQRLADNSYRQQSLDLQRDNKAGKREFTEAEKAIDKEFGEMYVEDNLRGQFNSAKNELDNLRGIHNRIVSGDLGEISGPVIGAIPTEYGKSLYNSKATAAKQEIFKAVQASLRATLGSAFTAKEGEALLARTFDVKLPTAENSRRLGILLDNLQKAQEAKAQAYSYFHGEGRGSLQGYKGPKLGGDQFLSAVYSQYGAGGSAGPAPVAPAPAPAVQAAGSGSQEEYIKKLEERHRQLKGTKK